MSICSVCGEKVPNFNCNIIRGACGEWVCKKCLQKANIGRLRFSMYKISASTIKTIINGENIDLKQQQKKQSTLFRLKNIADVIYVSGLSTVENTPCKITKLDDKYEFNILGTTFNLFMDKISDISVVNSIDIQKQYVSSVGGAAMGGFLVGPLGVAIGGRAKQKTIKNKTDYLIFSYINSENMQHIIFKISSSSQAMIVKKWEQEFKKHSIPEKQNSVDL